jgi:hypothetical protein
LIGHHTKFVRYGYSTVSSLSSPDPFFLLHHNPSRLQISARNVLENGLSYVDGYRRRPASTFVLGHHFVFAN